jgi:hypothetical protein
MDVMVKKERPSLEGIASEPQAQFEDAVETPRKQRIQGSTCL